MQLRKPGPIATRQEAGDAVKRVSFENVRVKGWKRLLSSCNCSRSLRPYEGGELRPKGAAVMWIMQMAFALFNE
jgi:hypothetical protein